MGVSLSLACCVVLAIRAALTLEREDDACEIPRASSSRDGLNGGSTDGGNAGVGGAGMYGLAGLRSIWGLSWSDIVPDPVEMDG
ncbi:hypothetical protein GE09DRAFT_1074806 [Coniochaeta sp. 2T2.1]|nr:hypothetical protein GE09DRAFT_1074806 [Coniochaeta sp. 2T2.1]